jgi:hypothetical protein
MSAQGEAPADLVLGQTVVAVRLSRSFALPSPHSLNVTADNTDV